MFYLYIDKIINNEEFNIIQKHIFLYNIKNIIINSKNLHFFNKIKDDIKIIVDYHYSLKNEEDMNSLLDISRSYRFLLSKSEENTSYHKSLLSSFHFNFIELKLLTTDKNLEKLITLDFIFEQKSIYITITDFLDAIIKRNSVLNLLFHIAKNNIIPIVETNPESFFINKENKPKPKPKIENRRSLYSRKSFIELFRSEADLDEEPEVFPFRVISFSEKGVLIKNISNNEIQLNTISVRLPSHLQEGSYINMTPSNATQHIFLVHLLQLMYLPRKSVFNMFKRKSQVLVNSNNKIIKEQVVINLQPNEYVCFWLQSDLI